MADEKLFDIVEQTVILPDGKSALKDKVTEVLEKNASSLAVRQTGNFVFDLSQSTGCFVNQAKKKFDVFRRLISLGVLDSTGGAGAYPVTGSKAHGISVSGSTHFFKISGWSTGAALQWAALPNEDFKLSVDSGNVVWKILSSDYGDHNGWAILEYFSGSLT